MRQVTILALRAVLVALFVGSVLVQMGAAVGAANDDDFQSDFGNLGVPILVVIILGIVTIQVVLVCTWKLATMVRHGTVFSHAAFRYIDIVIGAIAAAAVLMLTLASLLASVNTNLPEEDQVPPGMVLLAGGVALAIFGVALVVLVMRMLLVQAVARDAEANRMQNELDEVI